MENSIIEQQRQALEDIERTELAIVDMMQQDLTQHRYRLIREHKINELLAQIQSRSHLVLELEKDSSGRRHQEMEHMAAHQLEEFAARLGEIQSYHRRNPGALVHPPELEYAKYAANPEHIERERKSRAARQQHQQVLTESDDMASLDAGAGHGPPEVVETFVGEGDREKLDTMFSGDERLGRHVDLNAQHELFLNLKDAPRLTYLEYLAQLGSPQSNYSGCLKRLPAYTEYLTSLDEYFRGFFARSRPLFDLPGALDEARRQFDELWARQEVPGWEAAAEEGKGEREGEGEEEGGGLVCATCNRTFEKQTTYAAHMRSRKHQKAVERAAGQTGAGNTGEQPKQQPKQQPNSASDRDIAWAETAVRTYAQILGTSIRDTRADIERRQALTDSERRRELEALDQDNEGEYSSDNDGSSEEQAYNPLNLPLGWDGKPIPFWLYKLHGLGIKFTCEICGNTVYRGRKAYEKHFLETRHATNMRRLGIPNTRQFHGIAVIEEAMGLWRRVQAEGRRENAGADAVEEYEDGEGNVFNKKTYLDLKRQGLI
ncbi:Pre-mRNA-splicing factor sap61 [Coemansia erecta]|uniref:Pre-mRNA-splicing factor sap61 n=1 Tax=Coemansia erecta TaxID=147472 RepID=A0A9W8CRM2_9FUNG|nr:Pre-mRNA-splicing factor sap61 [Coemansia erecta]